LPLWKDQKITIKVAVSITFFNVHKLNDVLFCALLLTPTHYCYCYYYNDSIAKHRPTFEGHLFFLEKS